MEMMKNSIRRALENQKKSPVEGNRPDLSGIPGQGRFIWQLVGVLAM